MTTVILNENILFKEIEAQLSNEEFQQLKSLILIYFSQIRYTPLPL